MLRKQNPARKHSQFHGISYPPKTLKFIRRALKFTNALGPEIAERAQKIHLVETGIERPITLETISQINSKRGFAWRSKNESHKIQGNRLRKKPLREIQSEEVEKLLAENIRLIYFCVNDKNSDFARGIRGKANALGITFDELTDEASRIFIERLPYYDESRGTKLDTYMVGQIRYRLMNYLGKIEKEQKIKAIQLEEKPTGKEEKTRKSLIELIGIPADYSGINIRNLLVQARLTQREKAILRLIVEGYTYLEIGQMTKLHLRKKPVTKQRIQQIMDVIRQKIKNAMQEKL